MTPFDWRPATRVVFGAGMLDRLGELARELSGRRVLLVSDRGIEAAGHVARALDQLRRAGCGVAAYLDVRENPSTDDVDRCLAVGRATGVDLLVGLGGGSAMDTAKGANFLYTNGGRMADYWGVNRATRPMLPMIAVPTTSGTGSEAQSFALIADAVTHRKMACGDKKAACKVAILDPELTVSQPPKVTAYSGLDAVAHAVETAVCRVRTPLSQFFSREAWRLLSSSLSTVLAEPARLQARADMLWGAHLAGLAIENSMLGAAHALANPLTAAFGVVHGAAVSLMLPHVVRFNAVVAADGYRAMTGDGAAGDVAATVADRLTRWLDEAGLPTTLRRHGLAADDLPALADAAAAEWTATFNPRPVGRGDLLDLYRAAW